MTEYILVFRKPGEAVYHGAPIEQGSIALPDQPAVHGGHRQQRLAHRADATESPRSSMPIPGRDTLPPNQLYSYPDDLVLDPFVGSGQTIKVARHLKIGYAATDAVCA